MPATIPIAQERIILGIDPGTTIMGYGVLRVTGNNPELLTMGVLQLGKMGDHYLKLKRIFERVLGLIEQYHPDEMAIEAPFFREKCPIDAQTRPGTRYSYGCRLIPGHSHYRIRPAENKNGDYR